MKPAPPRDETYFEDHDLEDWMYGTEIRRGYNHLIDAKETKKTKKEGQGKAHALEGAEQLEMFEESGGVR